MFFFSLYPRLFFDLSVYRTTAGQPVRRSILTLAIFYLTLSVIGAILLQILLIPKTTAYIQNLNQAIESGLPQETRFVLLNGRLQVENAPTPLTFSLPPFPGTSSPIPVYINSALDLPALASAPGEILVGSDGLRFTTPTNEANYVDRFPAVADEELSVTKTDLLGRLQKLATFIAKNSWVILVSFLVSTTLILLLARTFVAAVMSVFMTMLGMTFDRPYATKTFMNILIHATIVVDTISLALVIIYQKPYPVVSQIAYIGISLLAFYSLPKLIRR